MDKKGEGQKGKIEGLGEEVTNIRIYGIPVEAIHDPSLGPITESYESYPFYGVLYCGFKTPYNEVRQPTNRLWYFKKSDVNNTGTLDDFRWDGKNVRHYDMDLQVVVFEKYYQQVALSSEIASSSHIFAKTVAVNPSNKVNPEPKSREEVEESVARLIEGKGINVQQNSLSEGGQRVIPPRPPETIKGTDKESRYDPWSRADPGPADSDVL